MWGEAVILVVASSSQFIWDGAAVRVRTFRAHRLGENRHLDSIRSPYNSVRWLERNLMELKRSAGIDAATTPFAEDMTGTSANRSHALAAQQQ